MHQSCDLQKIGLEGGANGGRAEHCCISVQCTKSTYIVYFTENIIVDTEKKTDSN
jgi:hypothetical protein